MVTDDCELTADHGIPQSPVSQSSVPEDIVLATRGGMTIEPPQPLADGLEQSDQQMPNEPLPELQPDMFSETLMFPSASSFPMTPLSVFGLGGGIPDFYFSNEAFADTSFLLSDEDMTQSENATAFLATKHPSQYSSACSNGVNRDDEDALIAEYVPHVPKIDEETRSHMINILKCGVTQSKAEEIAQTFPSLQHLDAYIQLYFEHFHRRWPILHVPTFEIAPQRWRLLFSVAFIGCQFSEAGQKHNHLKLLYELGLRILHEVVSLFSPAHKRALLTSMPLNTV